MKIFELTKFYIIAKSILLQTILTFRRIIHISLINRTFIGKKWLKCKNFKARGTQNQISNQIFNNTFKNVNSNVDKMNKFSGKLF